MANKTHNIDLNASCVNYNNVSQGVIHITEDKLHVILLKHEEKTKSSILGLHPWVFSFHVY